MVGLVKAIAKLKGRGQRALVGRWAQKRRPTWEALEGRRMLSGLGTDYTMMGGQWDNSRPVTFSIAPDGVSWDHGTNVANAKLNAEFGGTAWQGVVARALQTWAASTNLDFVQVGDGAYGFNSPGTSQGDPKFGDIRVGGYDFGDTSTIARTYGPPPNGQTGAGDVELNTGFDFSPGPHFDFGSVVLHELGHSLGLGESPQPSSVMYTYYSGNRQSLSPYDVEGIQSLYGARSADSYQSQGRGTSAANAIDLTTSLGSLNQTELGGLDLSTIGDAEYFSVVAPALGGATMNVTARVSGHSLLSPKISVIDPTTGASMASNGDASRYGDDVSASVTGVQAGHRYLIVVTGATSDVFAVGSYAVQVGFSGGTPLAIAPDPTPTPAPVPANPTSFQQAAAPIPVAPAVLPDRFAANNSFATAAELGPMGQTIVNNLTITSGSDVRVFTFEAAQAGTVLVASANTVVLVADFIGRPVVAGTSLIGFTAPVAGTRYFLIFLSPTGGPVSSFGFAVATIPAPPAVSLATVPTPTPLPTPTPAPSPISTTSRPSRSNPKVRAASVATGSSTPKDLLKQTKQARLNHS